MQMSKRNMFTFVLLYTAMGLNDVMSQFFVQPTLFRIIRLFRVTRILRLIREAKVSRRVAYLIFGDITFVVLGRHILN